MNKQLRTARIVYITFAAANLVYALLVWLLWRVGVMPIVSLGNTALTAITIAASLSSIFELFVGYYFAPRIIKSYQQKPQPSRGFIPFWVLPLSLRISMTQPTHFFAAGTYGVVLGLLGASWLVITPFFVVSIAALLLSFPTEKRWQKMLAPCTVKEAAVVHSEDKPVKGLQTMKSQLRIAQIMHGGFAAANVIYISLLESVSRFSLTSLVLVEQGFLNFMVVALSVVSIVNLLMDLYLPPWLITAYQRSSQERGALSGPKLLSLSFLRTSFFSAVGIYGLILGFLGASWLVITPFFAVSVAALLLSFPTEKRWQRMLG